MKGGEKGSELKPDLHYEECFRVSSNLSSAMPNFCLKGGKASCVGVYFIYLFFFY